MGDIIIDISEDGDIVGIEILDASKKFKIPKYELKKYAHLQVSLPNITANNLENQFDLWL